jgi:hypothetical protein
MLHSSRREPWSPDREGEVGEMAMVGPACWPSIGGDHGAVGGRDCEWGEE